MKHVCRNYWLDGQSASHLVAVPWKICDFAPEDCCVQKDQVPTQQRLVGGPGWGAKQSVHQLLMSLLLLLLWLKLTGYSKV